MRTWGKKETRLLDESKKRTKNLKKTDFDQLKKSGDKLNQQLAQAIEKALLPNSKEVQLLVAKHHLWIENFYTLQRS